MRLMTGRVIEEIFPRVVFRPGEEVLRVEHLTTKRRNVVDVTLSARAGEIVGFAGLVGAGKSEVARACFGLEPIAEGKVELHGEEVTGLGPGEMLRREFFYVPSDRRDEGLLMIRSCRENIVLPSLDRKALRRGPLLDRGAERALAERLARQLNLQPPRIERLVEHFSGGNQQKVLLAKSLTRPVKLFVFDEPTVGVDVGTRVAIYEFIRDLCENGAAVILISSDLPEVLNLSRRLYVFYRGGVRAELEGDQITQENVLRHFFEREAA